MLWAGILVIGLASVEAGLAAAAGESKATYVLPIGVAVMAGLGLLAIRRFEIFVLFILLTRSSLDAAKVSDSGGLDATALVSLAFLGLGAFWLVAQRRERPSAPSMPLVPPLLAYVGAAALSLPFSIDLEASATQLMRLATLVVVLLVLNRIMVDERRIRYVVAAVLGSAALPLLVAAYQVVVNSGFHLSGGFSRVAGTFRHPNPFAIFLGMIIVLGAAVYPHVERRWKAILIVTIAMGGATLVFTYTRSAWIAAILGLVIVGFQQSRTLLGLLVGAVVLVALLVPSVTARLSDLGEDTTASGAPGNSLVWRFEYWGEALSLVDNPVFGIGLNSVQAHTEEGKAPHNDFVRVYVETGLLGFSAYLWLLWRLMILAGRSLREAPPGLPRGVAVGFAGSLAAILLLSFVSNVISQLVILWYFAALAAAAVAATRVGGRRAVVPAS